MNQLLLVVVALGLFVYFGGNNVPKVLRDNKDMLLGVVVGLVLCSFMGMRLEGGPNDPDCVNCTDATDMIRCLGSTNEGVTQTVREKCATSAGATTGTPQPVAALG
jgi:hypothetical protein